MTQQLVITSGTRPNGPVEANGRPILVAGSQCVFEITGKSPEIKIVGRGNKIRVDEASSLVISGADCQVTAMTLGKAEISGSSNVLFWSKAVQGGEPQVILHGPGHQSRRA